MRHWSQSLGMIILLIFTSCDNTDKNNENNIDQAVDVLEDLDTDRDFNELLTKIQTSSQKVTDWETAEALKNKTTELTDLEKLQYVQALGYSDIENYQKDKESFWQSWTNIVARYPLLLQEKVALRDKLIVQLILRETQNSKTTIPIPLHHKKIGDCPFDDRKCFCILDFNACISLDFDKFYDRTQSKCIMLENGNLECGPFDQDTTFDEFISTSFALCLKHYQCCLIGYDSQECVEIAQVF